MKKYKKINLIVLLAALVFLTNVTNVFAATGYQGYAVYRNGVWFSGNNIIWHAAIMDDAYIGDTSAPIIHTPGSAGTKFDSWSNFLNGNTFQGVYGPKGGASSASRDLFRATVRNIAWRHIPYTAIYQVNYDLGSVGSYVDVNEISSIRCDGVVEYTYEWNNFSVWGSDDNWDVSVASSKNKTAHSGASINPKTQTSYLTKISSSEPY